MQNDVNKTTTSTKQSGLARWYSFNKQRIPMFLLLIAVLAITATLDFHLQTSTKRTIINFKSHISAIEKTTNNMLGFYLFLFNLFVLVQLFLSFSFSQKRSPVLLITMTVLTIAQILILVLYVIGFFTEGASRPSYSMGIETYISIAAIAVGTFFMLLATVFAWFYVDWKYVKVED